MTRRIIDLSEYSTGVPILAGRPRGEAVRAKENLDEVDRRREPVEIKFADYVYSINSSFFLGLFEKSIIDLGEDEFRRIYLFSGEVAEKAREHGIRRAMLVGKRFRPRRQA